MTDGSTDPRPAARDRLILAAGWAAAERRPLAGDASNRKYDRLFAADGRTAVLMDADPAKDEDVRPFLTIARALTDRGLSAPQILAADEDAGFLLIEDLGDALFARILSDDPAREAEIYAAATDMLSALHAAAPVTGIDAYDGALMGERAALAVDWYALGTTGETVPSQDFAQLVAELKDRFAPGQPVIALRDVHAENLLWLPDRAGPARVGLLDFQDALAGNRAYDLVSMLQDARRDVTPSVEEAMIARYADTNGLDQTLFRAEYAFCGAQRNLRILGVFARLSMHYAKPHYVDFIPRVWGLLQRDLAHPALAPLAGEVARLLPEPTPAGLQRIRDECGRHPLH